MHKLLYSALKEGHQLKPDVDQLVGAHDRMGVVPPTLSKRTSLCLDTAELEKVLLLFVVVGGALEARVSVSLEAKLDLTWSRAMSTWSTVLCSSTSGSWFRQFSVLPLLFSYLVKMFTEKLEMKEHLTDNNY